MLALRIDDTVCIHSRFMDVVSDIIEANRNEISTIAVIGTRERLLSVMIGLDRQSLPNKVNVYATFDDNKDEEVPYVIQIRAVDERILPNKKSVYCIALRDTIRYKHIPMGDTGIELDGGIVW